MKRAFPKFPARAIGGALACLSPLHKDGIFSFALKRFGPTWCNQTLSMVFGRSDGDGLPDVYEIAQGLNPNDPTMPPWIPMAMADQSCTEYFFSHDHPESNTVAMASHAGRFERTEPPRSTDAKLDPDGRRPSNLREYQ